MAYDNTAEGKLAQEPMYTRAGSSRAISTGLTAPTIRPATQVESLTRDFTQTANRLSLFNDNVEQKLEMFAPSSSCETEKDPQPACPPDGTLAALNYQCSRLRNEVERYGKLWERLAEII